jgi:hypothetical protein
MHSSRDGLPPALVNACGALADTLIVSPALAVNVCPGKSPGLPRLPQDSRRPARMLPEDAKVASQLAELLEKTKSNGKRVDDANVVATMLVNGVDTVITMSTGDFATLPSTCRSLGCLGNGRPQSVRSTSHHTA